MYYFLAVKALYFTHRMYAQLCDWYDSHNKPVISLNRMTMFFSWKRSFLFAEGTEFLNII
jgi:hypothetical protein